MRQQEQTRQCGKLFLLESSIDCHCKTIDFPFDRSREFHNHNGYEILLLLGGEINLYTEYGGVHMRPGDLVCIPAYEFHWAELLTEGQYDRIVINILDTELAERCTKQTNLEECFLRSPGTQLSIVHLPEEEIAGFCGWAAELEKNLYGGGVICPAAIFWRMRISN